MRWGLSHELRAETVREDGRPTANETPSNTRLTSPSINKSPSWFHICHCWVGHWAEDMGEAITAQNKDRPLQQRRKLAVQILLDKVLAEMVRVPSLCSTVPLLKWFKVLADIWGLIRPRLSNVLVSTMGSVDTPRLLVNYYAYTSLSLPTCGSHQLRLECKAVWGILDEGRSAAWTTGGWLPDEEQGNTGWDPWNLSLPLPTTIPVQNHSDYFELCRQLAGTGHIPYCFCCPCRIWGLCYHHHHHVQGHVFMFEVSIALAATITVVLDVIVMFIVATFNIVFPLLACCHCNLVQGCHCL